MRWGSPITTTVRGQGRLLRRKLAWVFQSRHRIKIFVLIVVVIASSASYGLVTLNNKNALRADEDDSTELPGLDYVEYTTQDLFSQALASVPPEQLTDYDKIALTTELAGDNYFRLSTAAERQDFLAAWDTSPEWRQFATQAESGEGGAWQWLVWLGPYCDGGGVARAPGLVPIAQAQSSNACILLLTELQTKKVVKAGEYPGLAVFETDWKQFWQRALNTCSSDPGSTTYLKCLSTARFFKTYYNSQDLDRIYNTYWKDLKHLRTKRSFGQEEIARLKKIDKYFRLKLQNKVDEAIGELGNLYFNVAISFVPIGRPVVAAAKGVGKALGFGIDVLAKAPLGNTTRTAQIVIGRGAMQAVRVTDKITNVSSAVMGRVSVNLSSIFKKSTISTSSVNADRMAKQLGLSVDSFMGDFEFVAMVAGRSGNEGLGINAVKQQIAEKAEQITANFRVLNTREFSQKYTKTGLKIIDSNSHDGFLLANVGDVEGGFNFSELPYSIHASDRAINYYTKLTDPRFIFVKKLSQMNIYRHSDNIGILTQGPLENGAAEYNARYFAAKHNYTIGSLDFLPVKGELNHDVYRAVLDASKRWNKNLDINLLHMNMMFKDGLIGYDPILKKGLNSKAMSIINGELFADSPIYTVEELLLDGKGTTAIKFLNALFR